MITELLPAGRAGVGFFARRQARARLAEPCRIYRWRRPATWCST